MKAYQNFRSEFMNRFEILTKNENMLYADTCPVLLKKHAITYDNIDDKVLLQLMLKNISEKIITALYISVKCYGADSEEYSALDEFVYLDLHVNKQDECGDQVPVYLPDKNTRKVEIKCKKIIFSDGTKWENSNNNFYKNELKTEKLENHLTKEQYSFLIDTINNDIKSKKIIYFPSQVNDLVICPCGAIYKKNQPCPICEKTIDWWKNKVDKQYLNKQIKEKKDTIRRNAEIEKKLKMTNNCI